MEKLKKITGKWHGTYAYEPTGLTDKRQPVPFTLVLKQAWFGRFTGSVTEPDPAPGVSGIGTIEGYFSFPRIEFCKRMPVCFVALPDGRHIGLREYLTEQGQSCERNVPGPPIFYEGEFSDAGRAQGSWIIHAQQIALGDGRTIPMPETKGVWSIEI